MLANIYRRITSQELLKRALVSTKTPTQISSIRYLYSPPPDIHTTYLPPLPNETNPWGVFSVFAREYVDANAQTPEAIWSTSSKNALAELSRAPPANAYSGRSVKVYNGNVAEAFKALETRLSRNKVKYELRLAERHEKKGVKRRRLSSERWRKQFSNEVRKKVLLVNEIRHRGA